MVEEQSTVSTPAQEKVAEVPETIITPTAKTFTEDEINRIVKERLDRERKKYADYNDLKLAKAKLDEIEMASKTNEERALAKLKDLETKLAEQERAVRAADTKEKKRAALESANLGIPKDVTLTELLDMIPGETDEAIESAITRLKKLFPVSKAQGIGTQVTETPNAGKKTIAMRLAEIRVQLKDRTLDNHGRDVLAKEMITLTNRQMRGEQ
jgi:hypothetical protein